MQQGGQRSNVCSFMLFHVVGGVAEAMLALATWTMHIAGEECFNIEREGGVW